MTLDRIIFILVCVVGAVVGLGWLISSIVMFGYDALSAWLMLIPLLVASFFIIWVIVERLRSKEDDHYDRIEK